MSRPHDCPKHATGRAVCGGCGYAWCFDCYGTPGHLCPACNGDKANADRHALKPEPVLQSVCCTCGGPDVYHLQLVHQNTGMTKPYVHYAHDQGHCDQCGGPVTIEVQEVHHYD